MAIGLLLLNLSASEAELGWWVVGNGFLFPLRVLSARARVYEPGAKYLVH